MTNRNFPSRTEPFLLRPVGKDYIWGGNRLNDDFAKGIQMQPLAETWECSTHPDGTSTVASGPFAGQTLTQVLREHPEFLGSHIRTQDGQLPILIKFIDAKQDLSVQVHPSDSYAKEHENGQLGKSEMWYVLDALENTSLIYGFNRTIDRETLRRSLLDGTVERYLQKVPIEKGDVFYIRAGTVHAIGAGALIAEIQESSNLTYRMYDYGRPGKDGKPRPLHIDRALDVADLTGGISPRQPMRVLRYAPGRASELLCRCKYFVVERWIINTERIRAMAPFAASDRSFQVLLCVDGCGVAFPEGGEALPFFRGDCLFVPAGSVPVCLHGRAQLLNVWC